MELEIQGGPSPRPLLSVPHLLSDESACYYHGYVLAEMAVHQTRNFFLKNFGQIVDNNKIGPMLEEAYWRPGNLEMFLDLVKKLTEEPLTGRPGSTRSRSLWMRSWVRLCAIVLWADRPATAEKERKEYDKAVARPAPGADAGEEEVDLKMRVRFVDGPTVIADTEESKGDFLAACRQFERFLEEKYPLAAGEGEGSSARTFG
uniref:Uncharacterized protein n=1 Tax=Guillardia theta (strain CCMP2712) TaxID=905079 RepID=A0A0C3SZF8_GUITC